MQYVGTLEYYSWISPCSPYLTSVYFPFFLSEKTQKRWSLCTQNKSLPLCHTTRSNLLGDRFRTTRTIILLVILTLLFPLLELLAYKVATQVADCHHQGTFQWRKCCGCTQRWLPVWLDRKRSSAVLCAVTSLNILSSCPAATASAGPVCSSAGREDQRWKRNVPLAKQTPPRVNNRLSTWRWRTCVRTS